jgi:hypothetical protein
MWCPHSLTGGNGFDPTILCFALCIELSIRVNDQFRICFFWIDTGPTDVGDTAMRLARYFGGTAQFWLNLQSIYDLRTAECSAQRSAAGD